MRNIILAVTIAVGAGTILYLLAWELSFPTDVAKGVSTFRDMASRHAFATVA